LALGVGLARLLGLAADAGAVVRVLERGARSGIGLGAFLTGGFLVDGGRGAAAEPPPIISRLAFPETWRLLLICDGSGPGLSGEAERAAFRALPPFPADDAAHLCRLTLMRLLPAIAEADLQVAGLALGELQRVVGDHFAPAQGARFTSPGVAAALGWIEAQGYAGVGQSSWGPTGFALLPDDTTAMRLCSAMQGRLGPALTTSIVAGRNHGAEIEGPG
jgi:beta-RFAP synthase